jgi:hypothetical protein
MLENIKASELLHDQLHSMANYPTKYESYQTKDLRGVGFAKYNYVANARKLIQLSPEKSHLAKQDAGRTNKRINGQTNGRKSCISSYYHLRGIKHIELSWQFQIISANRRN